MDVTTKSLGILLDDMITTNVKIFMLQEDAKTATQEEKGNIFDRIQTLNVRRNALINAVDKAFEDDDVASTTLKTYK
jgi:hypothetical protein